MSQRTINSFFGPSQGGDLFPRHWLEEPLPQTSTSKRPVGRPRKKPKTDSSATVDLTQDKSDSEADNKSTPSAETVTPTPTTPRRILSAKRGKYKAYNMEEKREAVKLSFEHGVTMVERRFNIAHSTLMTWRRLFADDSPSVERDVKSGRKIGSGRKLSYGSETEEKILSWILEQRDLQISVSRDRIRRYAKSLVGSSEFQATNGWMDRFLKRNRLSLRMKTHQAQRLPEDLDRRVEVFHRHIKELQAKHEIDEDFIINMDETSCFFDAVPSRTVDQVGAKTVAVRGTGAEKRHLTVVLAVTASGKTLPPMVIFKGKRQLKIDVPDGVLARVQEKAWMDSSLMLDWLQNVVRPYTERRPAMLVMDIFAGHRTEEVRAMMDRYNIVPAYIPGGCTSKVQPLDVSINKPFKAVMQKEWSAHMEEQLGRSRGQTAKTATKTEVLRWVKGAWANINAKTGLIKKSFQVTGIVGPTPSPDIPTANEDSDSDSDSDNEFWGFSPSDVPSDYQSDSDPFEDM